MWSERKSYMSDGSKESALIATLMEQLAGSNRRKRQEASHLIASIATTSADQLVDYMDDLVEALDRPEAQTRWEVLEALTSIASVDAQKASAAFDGAEASLFDETSATVRLAAFKFLVGYGVVAPERSDEAWPLLDEAIQCYHGDPEYRDMLVSLEAFAQGAISDKTAEALLSRMSFDASNGRGYVRTFSAQIVEALKTR